MRTSRIAKETSKATISVSPSKRPSQRQTRSFAASLTAFTADATILESNSPQTIDENSDGDSSLSSVATVASFDIEDCAPPSSISRKRKRSADSPLTTLTAASTTIDNRSSSSKADIKLGNGSEATVRKSPRQPARKVLNEAGEVEIHPPANWAEVYDLVKEMRKEILAPVDTMGCETLAEEQSTPRDKRFQTLIALMLSSQTKDTTTALAMRRLHTELPPPGLTLENILTVPATTLNTLIYAVGFHNNKTRYIKATALVLRDRHGGDIPDTAAGLMALPGVGPKMAYLCLSAAWGRTEGIGVDVHVHRITNLWGWQRTRTPEETRMALQAWLPRERWHEINRLLVGFGQTVCLPVGRRCGSCRLAERGLCPGVVAEMGKERKVKKEKKKKKEVVGKVEVRDLAAEEGDPGLKVEGGTAVLIKEEGEEEIVSQFFS
ncbi:DNA N-glycosylase and apurinic/apyrimidinic (AP) lyase [Schaereria dolodes]|nr:DNA N-glycosylase and apurinic/apyrimidinic (AP) lyase [Schaereria dolodes]